MPLSLLGQIEDSSGEVGQGEEDDDECARFLGKEGSKTARFTKVKRIGSGTHGEAYVVRDNQNPGKMCVVKVVSTTSLSAPDLQSEIRCMSLLRHPCIIEYVADFGTQDRLLIAMEFAEGGDLNQHIKARTSPGREPQYFKEHEVMFLFCQLAVALDYVHKRRMLHRDLKTANVFLNAAGIVKLGDFGYSRIYSDTLSNQVAETFCGTPCYLAPELWVSQRYSKQADVWSLGVVLYELLCLRKPFFSANMGDLRDEILNGGLPPLPPRYSADVRGLCGLLLAKDPKKRASLQELFAVPFFVAWLKKLAKVVQKNKDLCAEERMALVKSIEEAYAAPAPAPQPAFRKAADGSESVALSIAVLAAGETVWRPCELIFRSGGIAINCSGDLTTFNADAISNACPVSHQDMGGRETIFGIFFTCAPPVWLRANSLPDMNKCVDDVLAISGGVLRYPSAKRTRATRSSVKMDRINALIQEARGMAERANRDQLDAVFGILDVATTLLRRQIEANSGEPAQQRPPLQQQQQPKQQQQQAAATSSSSSSSNRSKQQQQQQQQQTQQRRPQEQQQPQPQQQQQQQTQQRRPQEQQQPQQRPRQGYAPTWAEVTRRPPPPGKIDAADWDAPVLPSPDFEAVEAGLWVAPSAAAAEEAKGPAADAVDVAERDGKRVRLGVLCREAFDDARRGPVLLEGGRVQDMYLWAGGGPVCQRGQVKVQKMPVGAVKPNAATTVLAFVVARKHASPETWECVERDPRTALTRLCRRAVKTALKTEVRVPDDAMGGASWSCGCPARAEAILANGGFWRSTEKACRDAMPVVALQKGVTRAVALAVAERAGAAAAGLVLTGSRLLVRARSGAVLEEVRAAAAEHAAAPLESKPRFLVVGATPREHEADVEYVLREAGWQVDVATSFLRSGARVCVVTSAADPPFRVLQREGAPDLRVNPYDGGELPRERRRRLAAAPSGKRRMRLPAAEVDELPQPAAPPADAAGQKKRKTPEPAADGPEPAGDDVPMDGAEAGGHVHAFGSPAKATAGFSCALCGKKKAKGQIRTTCEGCNVGACKACAG
ncbi:putative serine/threonine-protein kinase A [Diplonema papillatum]|nr:putative serine/threonine-protein kinase A [Diplonema papillatum]